MALMFHDSGIRTLLVLLLAAGRTEAQAPKGPPLASFVAQRIAVMPVQLLRSDSAAFVRPVAWAAFRRELDDSIGSAIAERGVGKKWAYAADIARTAKRNAVYVSDPYSLGVQPLRSAVYKVGDKIPDLFGSNLRSLIALGDARYALVPVEVMFVRVGAQQRAVMRLILVDGRAGLFMWAGDVASEATGSLTPVVISSLAARVADLIVAP